MPLTWSLTAGLAFSTTKVSAYLSESTYVRARAAFKSAAHLEGDSSWSDFVDSALQREAQRREAAHHYGHPFSATTSKLSPGRPLS
jgi:hypothetical protein